MEASDQILSQFSRDLANYTQKWFRKRKIELMTNSPVKGITDDYVELGDGYRIEYGLVVWATGNAPVEMTKKLPWEKDKSGRVIIDDHLHVPETKNIFAIGDASVCAEKHLNMQAFMNFQVNSHRPLPPTAQCAKQQGRHLAIFLNDLLRYPCDEWEERLQQKLDTKTKNFHCMRQSFFAILNCFLFEQILIVE